MKRKSPSKALTRALGLSSAVTVHAALIGLFMDSLGGAPVAPLRQAGEQAIALGLTRVQADGDRSASFAAFTGELGRESGALSQAPANPGPSANSSVLAEMEAPSGEAAAQSSQKTAKASAPRSELSDDTSPWTRAGLTAVDGAKARQLWSAAARCWHGGVSFTPSEIRIVLDSAGAVTSMTWLGGGDAGARTQAEAVAAAINACAPYHAVAPAAGAYLVEGPLA